MGDSQCTIACVEADNRVLDIWFSNRVAEVRDRMESWKRQGIKVNSLYHWPGESNVADLGTKGRAEAQDVIQGSDWQDGPVQTRYPVERWPISRDFVREIPEEEKRAAVYGAHQSLSLLSKMQDEDLSLKTRHESVVMAIHTGEELNNNLCRYVPHQVVHQNSTQGPTGSRVGSQPFHDHERPAM